MRLSTKILISNISISIFTMFLIGVSVFLLVGGAVKSNLIDTLTFESLVFEEAYLSNSKNLSIYKNFATSLSEEYSLKGIHTLFIPDNDDSTLYVVSTENGFEEKMSKIDMKFFLNQPLNNIYEVDLEGIRYLAYNRVIQNSLFNIQVRNDLLVSLIPLDSINTLRGEIFYFIVIAVMLSLLLSSIILHFIHNALKKPVDELISATIDIGNKNFDRKININSKDEFEVLGNAIQNMAKNLKEKDSDQRQFYETVSHELKTPVAVISGYIEGLQSGIISDKDGTYDIVIDECSRIKKQLENMIYLSKLDSVKDNYNFINTNINEVIINSLNAVESVIIINEISVIYEPQKDMIALIDSEKMQRVFVNILYNCIKYTNEDIYIKLTDCKSYIEIQIGDDGCGFSESLLKNPFDGNIVGEKGGTGIGLKIVKKIIDSHKGEIILSNSNEGALYTLKLYKKIKGFILK
ncbi:MAG: sensor histidine kinase [Lachnospirales bacterium]